MIEDHSQKEDIEFVTALGDGPPVLYPLVARTGNQRVLRSWLADHESYRLADDDVPVTEAEFDLCIVDQEGLRTHTDDLVSVKSAARPVLLPVLLLMSEHQPEIIEADRGTIADSVFVSTVDEIVSLPLRQVELEWRIQALLRLRSNSLELQERTETLRRFRQAADAAGHAIYMTAPDGTIEYVNPAFERITGYSRDEALGATPGILNSGEMPDSYFEDLWETVTSGEVWSEEVINRRKSGDLYVAHQTIAPITDGDEVSAFVAIQTDITEREEANRQLGRYRNIVQRLEDPIMLQDEAGRFELLNDAVADFTGLPVAELLGEDESLFMDEETGALIDRKKQAVLDTEQPAEYRVSPTFEHGDANATFSTKRYPYYDESGELVGTIAICRDVTELEERTRQLQVIDTVLRHNLRNGLTVIGLLAEQIAVESDGELTEAAGTIVRTAQDLQVTGEKSREITTVLGSDPETTPVDIADSVRILADRIASSRPDVQVEVDAPAEAVASATANIDRAIEELINNAITHNDGGSATVELRVAVGDAVEISVIDDGPGMAEMDRDVLETGAAVEDLYHGGGLGLWLVYWIVNRSGGSIAVSDVQPQGTNVTITLPRSDRADRERTSDGAERERTSDGADREESGDGADREESGDGAE